MGSQNMILSGEKGFTGVTVLNWGRLAGLSFNMICILVKMGHLGEMEDVDVKRCREKMAPLHAKEKGLGQISLQNGSTLLHLELGH